MRSIEKHRVIKKPSSQPQILFNFPKPPSPHTCHIRKACTYCGVQFKTYSGLPFTYEIRKGRSGEYTKELWIDRRGKSKSLAWSSVLLALGNIKKVGEVVERPKALSDIRGVTYIYGMFYRFGLIDMPKEVKEKKNDRGNKKQKKGREDMLEENIKFFRRL